MKEFKIQYFGKRMQQYDSDENLRRLRAGLTGLLLGRTTRFSDAEPNLIVVFHEKASHFSGGRVLLFQQFFLDYLGVIPQIIRQAPGCIKVFLEIGAEPSDICDLLNTDAFREMCRDLRVMQISFRDRILFFKTDEIEEVRVSASDV